MKRTCLFAGVNLLLLVVMLLLLEGAVRLLRPDILKQTLSAGLFTADRFRESLGNTPSMVGAAFGVPVSIDAQGFRGGAISRKQAGLPRYLLVGDSVGFGAGVGDEETFAAILNRQDVPFIMDNGCVIGYGMRDYYNVLSSIDLKPYTRVVLVYCLNDILDSSPTLQAQVVEEQARQHRGSLFARLRYYSRRYFDFNRFLGEYSRLYLLAKLQADPQMRQTRLLLEYYDAPEYLASMADWMTRIADLLRQRHLPLLIVVCPFEYQLRDLDQAWLLPQRLVVSLARERHIPVYDLTSDLADSLRRHPGQTSRDLYLTGHESHFSPLGHRLIAKRLAQVLTSQDRP